MRALFRVVVAAALVTCLTGIAEAAGPNVPTSSVITQGTSPWVTSVGAGTANIGGVALGPVTTAPMTAQIALTSVTTGYTALWTIANSATAASVTIPYFAVNVANSTVAIPAGRLVSDDPLSTAWTGQTVQVDLWKVAPVYATSHGDRTTFLLTSGSLMHQAAFSCTFGAIQTDGPVSAECTPNTGSVAWVTADALAQVYVTMIATSGTGTVTASSHLTFIPKVVN
jgi:hypothetical protein